LIFFLPAFWNEEFVGALAEAFELSVRAVVEEFFAGAFVRTREEF